MGCLSAAFPGVTAIIILSLKAPEKRKGAASLAGSAPFDCCFVPRNGGQGLFCVVQKPGLRFLYKNIFGFLCVSLW
jgi:hypothetical protein